MFAVDAVKPNSSEEAYLTPHYLGIISEGQSLIFKFRVTHHHRSEANISLKNLCF
jgi:hypothetical protein